jgi:hypothetical protein
VPNRHVGGQAITLADISTNIVKGSTRNVKQMHDDWNFAMILGIGRKPDSMPLSELSDSGRLEICVKRMAKRGWGAAYLEGIKRG